MISWPMTTMGQLHQKKGPASAIPRMKRVKMPVDGEI